MEIILKQDILENRWKENDKFFSVRQISIKYGLNPNTVLKVVKALEEELGVSAAAPVAMMAAGAAGAPAAAAEEKETK